MKKYVLLETDESGGCAAIIGWLIGFVIVVLIGLWLAVNVVLPVVLLNAALVLTILAVRFNKRKILFAVLALVGGCYMLMDIINGWFSANFVNNVVEGSVWISGFAYINAAAIGLSSWFLVQPIWSYAIQIRASDKRKGIILTSISILLVASATITIPIVYHSIQNPFTTKFNSGGAVELLRQFADQANAETDAERAANLERYKEELQALERGKARGETPATAPQTGGVVVWKTLTTPWKGFLPRGFKIGVIEKVEGKSPILVVEYTTKEGEMRKAVGREGRIKGRDASRFCWVYCEKDSTVKVRVEVMVPAQ